MDIRSKFPGPGLLILAASVVAVGGFMAWGAREPELDRVWRELHELKIGAPGALEPGNISRLRAALVRHPGIGPALLDRRPVALLGANTAGWIETEAAVLIASADGPDPQVTFLWRPPRGGGMIRIRLEGAGSSEEVELSGNGPGTAVLSQSLRAGGGLIVVRPANAQTGALSEGLQILISETESSEQGED